MSDRMCCEPILIVEDDADVRETVKDILEYEGFTVITAANGEEALALLRAGHQSCLILLDLMMPVMNGWQFLAELKQAHVEILHKVPIVVVSAAADVTSVEQQYACRVMQKPCDIDALVSVAREYCLAS